MVLADTSTFSTPLAFSVLLSLFNSSAAFLASSASSNLTSCPSRSLLFIGLFKQKL
jgi:hypothetical protein